MMDEDSATSEPDVGAIDLSSHSSGRRRRAAARHGEHFNTVFLDMCPRVHEHTGIYCIFIVSISNGQ